MDKYEFEVANLSDIREIALIEEESFKGFEGIYKKNFLIKWYIYNPRMFWVVRNMQTKQVVGFTIMVPIFENLYNKLLGGKVHDLGEFNLFGVLTNSISDYYYFSDICLSKQRINDERDYYLALLTMMSGLQEQLVKTGVKRIVSTTITEEGKRTCKRMYFKEIATSDYMGREVYTMVLEVTRDVKKRIRSRTENLVNKFCKKNDEKEEE